MAEYLVFTMGSLLLMLTTHYYMLSQYIAILHNTIKNFAWPIRCEVLCIKCVLVCAGVCVHWILCLFKLLQKSATPYNVLVPICMMKIVTSNKSCWKLPNRLYDIRGIVCSIYVSAEIWPFYFSIQVQLL